MSAKVAIIGYACRLPGDVSNPEDLWELCTRKRDGWGPIPKQRFSCDAFNHPNSLKPGTFNPKGGYFLKDDLSQFDAGFFNITASEAVSLDPQQRLMLECTFEAIESAGIPKEQIAGRDVGVYVGGNFSDYELRNMRDLETTPMHQATGCAPAMQSGRISYFFDLRGPSMTIDTACSGSLVALHHAVRSLCSGESSEAIVAGCRLNLIPDQFVTMSMSQLFNDEGKTFAFDERAESGFARGEGAGVVLLKPLEAAIRDRNPIRAIICSTGTNQDGKTQGITNPSGRAQQELIKQVYSNAKLDTSLVGYAEMHGTGTKVGDPIEAAAVHEALCLNRPQEDPLYIGSVKTNVGHLEGASGIISVIKATMMLEKELLLPSVNFRKANPAIPLEKWNMKVLTSTIPWPRGKKYISVSNYGFGGTNAHAVLEKPPLAYRLASKVETDELQDPATKLFTISANDLEALRGRIEDLGVYFQQRPEVFEKMLCSNVAYTLGCRRSHLAYRLAIFADSLDTLGIKLAQTRLSSIKVLNRPDLGFVFTGQGAQWARMGLELMDAYPIYAKAIARADTFLTSIGSEFSLLHELQKEPEESRINVPSISQPVCTALQIGLVELLASWGLRPSAVVGHSSGEIAAAYAAGIYDADAAMALAYYRGLATVELKDKFPNLRGGMIAVGANAEDVKQYVKALQTGYATIACINSPSSVTVSGDKETIIRLKSILDAENIFNRLLKIDVAYHSEHMNNVSHFYRASISRYQPSPDMKARFYSSVYGHEISCTDDIGPEYWIQNLRSTVLFTEAFSTMCSAKPSPELVIELGPHSTMKGPIKDILKTMGIPSTKIEYCNTIIRSDNAVECLQQAAGIAYTKGAILDMAAINFPSSQTKFNTLLLDLPLYRWSHSTSYWHDARIPRQHELRQASRNDILGVLASYSNELEPTWRNIIHLEDMPWLRHHKMQGLPVFPMAGYISMVVEALRQRGDAGEMLFDYFELRDVVVGSALTLDEDVATEVTLNLRPFNDAARTPTNSWDEFRISSWASNRGWIEHCRGLSRLQSHKKPTDITAAIRYLDEAQCMQSKADNISTKAIHLVDEQAMYKRLDAVGAGYGHTFQGLNKCSYHGHYSRGEIVLQDTQSLMPKAFETDLIIHPSFLDTFIQLVWPILGAANADFNTLWMPTEVRSIKIGKDIVKKSGDTLSVWCKADPVILSPKCAFELFATDTNHSGESLIHFEDFVMTPLRDPGGLKHTTARKICYKLVSQPFAMDNSGMTADGMQETDPHDQSSEIVVSDGADEDIQMAPSSSTSSIRMETISGSEDETTPGTSIIDTDSEPDNVQDIALIRLGDVHSGFEERLTTALERSTYFSPTIFTLGEIECDQKWVLLLQTSRDSLRSISEATFNSLKDVLLRADRVLWVYSLDDPESSMSIGLARSIRSENMARITMLGLESLANSEDQHCKNIIRALNASSPGKDRGVSDDMEIIARGEDLFVQRIEEVDVMNRILDSENGSKVLEKQAFCQPGRSLKLEIGTYGSLDTLHWVDEERLDLPQDYVEIEVKATGVNFKDVVVCMGQVSQPYIGVECSGIVAAVGKSVSEELLGQRVMAMTEGGYSTYAKCLATSVWPISEKMSFEQAATIPVVFCTAYYALIDLARLANGESILIHAAAGGVGQAAIMLAKLSGAEIYATVGSKDKKQFLIDTYNISEERILYSRDTSFASNLQRLTKGVGVDVVLNSLSGEILQESWNCLAPFGRFIEIGKTDINSKRRLEMSKFEYNCTFSSVDLTKVAAYKPYLMQRLLKDVNDLFNKGSLTSISPITRYSIAETETAFRALQSGKAMGKLVVVPNDKDEILAAKPRAKSHQLRSDATYLIIGGTGGLGRSLAKWMATNGARTIVLLSRSARISTEVQALINQVAGQGTKIHVMPCDISKKTAVEHLFNTILRWLPPIAGIIHSAMVLQDVLFENMTLKDFHTVTSSKVDGVINLHEALATTKLEFFIALSSVAGVIGNRGQAAYSAANVFLDEFMSYRRKQGLPGTSIDLAAVSDVGYLAQGSQSRREEVSKNIDGQTISETEVIALVAAAVSGQIDRLCDGQCITGLYTQNESAFWLSDAKFESIRKTAQESSGTSAMTGAIVSLKTLLSTSPSKEDSQQTLFTALQTKISSVLDLPTDAIEPSQSLKKLGLDSLVAIEIRNWIGRETEVNVQVLELLTSGSVMGLVDLILKKMGL